jgi:hypothetical protein
MKKNSEMSGQNIINVNVPGPSSDKKGVAKYIGPFKDAFNFLANASFYSIFKVSCVAVITVTFIIAASMSYKALTSDAFIDAIAQKVTKAQDDKENKNQDIRDDKVTPKIQKEIEVLCYSLDADRVFIFEMHNGKRNSTGLPFRYADMSYEEVNDSKHINREGINFQNVPLTLYKFPHYVAEHGYMYGDIEEIAKIDKGFAEEMAAIGGKHLAVVYVTTNGVPLGFIGVAFHDAPKFHNEYIRGIIESHARVITPLLDLRQQIILNN